MNSAVFMTRVSTMTNSYQALISAVGTSHPLVENDHEVRQALRDLARAIVVGEDDMVALRRLVLSVDLLATYIGLQLQTRGMCEQMRQANRLAYLKISSNHIGLNLALAG